MSDIHCPECGSDAVSGWEISGVYDGILFWVCLACDFAYPRDFGDWKTRQAQSNSYASQYNEQVFDGRCE
jgi:rubredoxin